MHIPHPGEVAALVTAVSWSGTSILFSAAGRRGGAPAVNIVRLVLATVILFGILCLFGRLVWPGTGEIVALALSGVVGLSLGDAAYFRALAILGPRRASIIMMLAPVMVALLMVPLLGETLGLMGVFGMAVTLAGVAWVQLERDPGIEIQGSAAKGLAFAFLGALGQAGGYVLTKAGLGAAPDGAVVCEWFGIADGADDVDPLLGTFIRMLAGLGALASFAFVGTRPQELRVALRDRTFVTLTGLGTVLGPVFGVWMSLVAVSMTNTAVAGTIIAASPVFVIPLMRIFYGHRATWRAWMGALVALIGVGILSYWS